MTRTTRICASYMANHTPQYAEVDAHHVYPKYLAHLLDIPERTETADLCAGCHDLVHHVIRHYINEGGKGGHRLAPGLGMLAARAWGWWRLEVV